MTPFFKPQLSGVVGNNNNNDDDDDDDDNNNNNNNNNSLQFFAGYTYSFILLSIYLSF